MLLTTAAIPWLLHLRLRRHLVKRPLRVCVFVAENASAGTYKVKSHSGHDERGWPSAALKTMPRCWSSQARFSEKTDSEQPSLRLSGSWGASISSARFKRRSTCSRFRSERIGNKLSACFVRMGAGFQTPKTLESSLSPSSFPSSLLCFPRRAAMRFLSTSSRPLTKTFPIPGRPVKDWDSEDP